MLDEHAIEYRYREYTKEPLDKAELVRVLAALGMKPKDVLRKKDPAFKQAGLTGNESDAKLIALMVEHPTLLERPIGVRGKRAVLGRPPEKLLELAK